MVCRVALLRREDRLELREGLAVASERASREVIEHKFLSDHL